jgi:hypothetical protein
VTAGLIGNGSKSIGGAYQPPNYAPVSVPLTSYPYFVFTGWIKFDGIFTAEDADETSGRQFTPESYSFQLLNVNVAPNSLFINVVAVPGVTGGSVFEEPGGMRTNAIRVNYYYNSALASIDIRFTNQWVFIYAEMDVSNRILTLEVNDSSQTINGSGSPSATFTDDIIDAVGITVSGYSGYQGDDFIVLIDEMGFTNNRLTPAERSYIYNNGAGRTYPFS